MDFRKIWNIGGFIFSELVDTLKKRKNINCLNPKNENSFFINLKNYKFKDNYNNKLKINREYKDKYIFVSNSFVGNNKILIDQGFDKGTTAYFISRFYPSDYYSIICTFTILKDFNYKFSDFIIFIIEKFKNENDIIPKILYSLYLLTYFDIGQKESETLNYHKYLEEAKLRHKEVLKIINNKELFMEKYEKFKKRKYINKKEHGVLLEII